MTQGEQHNDYYDTEREKEARGGKGRRLTGRLAISKVGAGNKQKLPRQDVKKSKVKPGRVLSRTSNAPLRQEPQGDAEEPDKHITASRHLLKYEGDEQEKDAIHGQNVKQTGLVNQGCAVPPGCPQRREARSDGQTSPEAAEKSKGVKE